MCYKKAKRKDGSLPHRVIFAILCAVNRLFFFSHIPAEDFSAADHAARGYTPFSPLCRILGTHTESVLSGVAVSRLKHDQDDLTDQGNKVEENP